MNVEMISRFFCRLKNFDGFRLEQFPATIGRCCDSQLHFTDRFVSRAHCRIEKESDRFVICDLDSRHGTRVNGKRIDRSELRPGDELQIGLHVFHVQCVGNRLLLAPVKEQPRDALPAAEETLPAAEDPFAGSRGNIAGGCSDARIGR